MLLVGIILLFEVDTLFTQYFTGSASQLILFRLSTYSILVYMGGFTPCLSFSQRYSLTILLFRVVTPETLPAGSIFFSKYLKVSPLCRIWALS